VASEEKRERKVRAKRGKKQRKERLRPEPPIKIEGIAASRAKARGF
jgi:hypothetical protein